MKVLDTATANVALRYSERLADVGAIASIGTVGDSYDNALAETVVRLYKTECVKLDGPFRTADELEYATLSWVHWFNENLLHSAIGYLTPIEMETLYYRENTTQKQPLLGELTLHSTRGDSHCDPPTGKMVAVAIGLTLDTDRVVRDHACLALAVQWREVDTPELRDALAARLDDIDRDARSEALVGLAYCHDPRARPRVRAALSRPSGDVWRLEIVAAGALSDPTLHELVQRHQDGWSTVADATTADARPVSRTYVRATCRAGLGGFKGSDVLRPDHI